MKHCLYVVLCCIGISVVLCGIYSLSSAGAEFVEKFQRNNAVNAKANVVSNESLPQSFDEVLFTGDVIY